MDVTSNKAYVHVRSPYIYYLRCTGTVSVVVKDLFLGETQSLAVGGELMFRPGPGTYKIEIALSSGSTASLVEIDEVVPVDDRIDLRSYEVSVGSMPSSAAVSPVSVRFSRNGIAPLTQIGFYRRADGHWTTDFEWDEWTLTWNSTYFVANRPGDSTNYRVTFVLPDYPGASDTNSGNEPSSARKTLVPGVNTPSGSSDTLLSDNTPGFIVLQAGYKFTKDQGWNGYDLGANKVLVSSIPGVPTYLTAAFGTAGVHPAWTSIGTDEYTATGTYSGTVYIMDFGDLDDFASSAPSGLPLDFPRPRYVPYDTGTVVPRCWVDGGGVLHYKTNPGHVPTADLTFIFPAGLFEHKHEIHAHKLLMKDVELWGSKSAFLSSFASRSSTDPTPDEIFVDCAFRFAPPGTEGIVSLNGEGYTVFKRCEVTDGYDDGVDAKDFRFVVEDGCTIGYTGIWFGQTRDIRQASTGHDGCRFIRVDSEYLYSGGPLLQDALVTSNTDRHCYSIVLGCFLHDSWGSTSPSRRYAISAGGSGNGDASETWLLDPWWGNRFGDGGRFTLAKFRFEKLCYLWCDRSYASWEFYVGLGTATIKCVPTAGMPYPVLCPKDAASTAEGDALNVTY